MLSFRPVGVRNVGIYSALAGFLRKTLNHTRGCAATPNPERRKGGANGSAKKGKHEGDDPLACRHPRVVDAVNASFSARSRCR